jgi:hypothetical protein
MAICTYHAEGDAEAIEQIVRGARPTYRSTATESQTYFCEGDADSKPARVRSPEIGLPVVRPESTVPQ